MDFVPFAIRYSLLASLRHPDLLQILHHAGMNQRRIRRGGQRIGGRGLAGLGEFLAERLLDPCSVRARR